MDAMSFADRSWPVLRRLIGAHTVIYRVTNGMIGHRFPGAPPVLLLDHVGAKTGITRTTPLVYVEDRSSVVLVASKGGHPSHPAWYHNLRANPDVTIELAGETFGARAVVVDDEEEYERLYGQHADMMPSFNDYRQKTTRRIPVVLLDRAP